MSDPCARSDLLCQWCGQPLRDRREYTHHLDCGFECVGGPLDGEWRPATNWPREMRGGFYVLDDTPRGAHFRWLPEP